MRIRCKCVGHGKTSVRNKGRFDGLQDRHVDRRRTIAAGKESLESVSTDKVAVSVKIDEQRQGRTIACHSSVFIVTV